MPMSIRLKREVEIPEGTEIEIKDMEVKVKGPKGELQKIFKITGVELEKKDNKIIIKGLKSKKEIGAKIGTIQAHLKNMIDGVNHGYLAKMKIVYSHFPMNIAVKEDRIEITNFAGEKRPRIAKIIPGVKVNVKGKDITIEGIDKEAVGQTAANIEQKTKVKGKDRRIYFDGIYITEKPHKVL